MVVDMENYKRDQAKRGTAGRKGGDVYSGRSRLSSFEGSTGIRSKLSVSARWPAMLSAAMAYNLYRIVEEALSNVRLHSAAARGDGQLGSADSVVVLTVHDDGRGLVRAGSSRRSGMGMVGMEERA